MCWYCYWGVAKPVADIYEKAIKRLGGDDFALRFGPAHIVWGDYNWDCIGFCLEECKHPEKYNQLSKDEIEVVRWSLQELEKVPLDIRDCQPEMGDSEDVAKFPPPISVEMVKLY